MKKIVAMILSCLLAICCLVGCDILTQNKDDEPISLTMDNYDYYLTINTVCTSSGSAAGGTVHYATYQKTFMGALNGVYKDCVITYQVADNNKEVSLNVAGYAQISYSLVNSETFSIVDVRGEIYI